MGTIQTLLDQNKIWAARLLQENPQFFSDLAGQQAPEYLWIGCSDSRVPANQITGLAPGEIFVHRNVANLVAETDFNVLAVLQYAVDILKVRHIIVCGHYGCGGIIAAMENFRHGMIDNWLSGVRRLKRQNQNELDSLPPALAADRLCELNVIEQARHVANTTILEDAWQRGQNVTVHSWIYRLETGIITNLNQEISGPLHGAGPPAKLP
ncbi:MAG: carbonate dehydratase [Verrucomicrobiota bacterium]